jgi:hypothetical protein
MRIWCIKIGIVLVLHAKRLFSILEQSENMRKIIQPKDIINSRRQAPNLKKMLTKACFTTKEDIPSVRKCGTCTYTKEGNRIQLKSGMEIRANLPNELKITKFDLLCNLPNMRQILHRTDK